MAADPSGSPKNNSTRKAQPSRKLHKKVYEQFISITEDIIVIEALDNNGRPGEIIEINGKAIQSLGYSEEEFQNIKMRQLVVDVDPEYLERVFKNLMESGSATLETNLLSKKGTIIPFEVKSHIFEESGLKYIFSIARNISKRKEQEKTIKKEMEFIEAAINAQHDTFFVFDPNTGQALYWNKVFEEISGYSTEEIAELPAPETYYNEQDLIKAKDAVDQVLKHGSAGVVIDLIGKNGKKIPTEYSVSLINDENEDAKYIISIGRDITEKNKIEKELRISRERLLKAQQIAHVGSFEADFINDVVYWSDEVIRIYRRNPEEYSGIFTLEESFQWVHPDDIEFLHKNVQQAAEQHMEEISLHYRIVWPDGTVRNVIGTTRLHYGENWAFVGIEGTVQDITDRLVMEQKIADKTNQLQTLINATPDIICFKDGEGRWLEANQADLELFQLVGVDYKGKTDAELAPYTHPKYKHAFNTCMDSDNVAWEKGTLSRGEEIIPTVTGEEKVYDVIKVPVFKENGEREGLVVLGRDITDRVKAEKERDKIEADFRQAQKMEAVGRLAGGVAHDFNNMLNVIMGNTEMAMLSVSQEDPLYQELKEIEKATLRSTDLTRQLLAFSRKQSASPRIVNLNNIIVNQKRMLSRLIGEHIEIDFNGDDKLWNVFVDPSQLDQILTNLAVNARDAIHEVGKVTIETNNIVIQEENREYLRELEQDEYVQLKFTDTGAGMDAKIIEQIFEPFFTTKAKGKGTGLGLSTVYGIIKQNKGMISANSIPGTGSTFEIYLPRYTGESDRVKKEDSSEHLGGKETILIVEDEKSVRRLAQRILESNGYRVYTASKPSKALDIIEVSGEDIDLLLTDVIMPQMNGKELTECIIKKFPNIRTLFMSGYTADVIAKHGVLEKDVDFLQKPFSLKALVKKIRVILDRE